MDTLSLWPLAPCLATRTRHAYVGGMMPAFLAVARHLLSCLQRLSLSLTQILSLSPSPKAFKLSPNPPPPAPIPQTSGYNIS